MKNKIFLLSFLLVSAGVSAQDIYQLGDFSATDLNGTARYVGLGGAMNSLGADLSTMSTNPAGTALYRHSDIAVTASIASQLDADKFHGKNPTHVNFDQIGFVYALNLNGNTTKFLNFGFNYHKSKDFNTLVNTSRSDLGNFGNASATWQYADLANFWGVTGTNANPVPSAQMAYEDWLINDDGTGNYDAYGATANAFRKAQWGSLQEYDINLGLNLSNQFYLGFTVGMHNVDFNSYMEYDEALITSANVAAGNMYLTDHRDVSGTGVDFKAGMIIRPIKDNPFRFGFSFSTPTYYNLKMRSTTYLDVDYADASQTDPHQWTDVDYKYNLYTPWKFNFSLGSTFFNCLAVDAEYEYADFSKAKISYDRGGWLDDWGDYYDDNEDDEALKNEADRHMKGVSTIKLGLEYMVDPHVALRVGYNYVSSPYNKSAYRNQFINSASLDYTTTTDYMNLSEINRFTCGIGLTFGKFYADAAYMYQNQHGDFYAFNTQMNNPSAHNDCPSSRIKLDRSKFMLTIGYRF